MARIYDTFTAATLVLVAAAAVGCSEGDKPRNGKAVATKPTEVAKPFGTTELDSAPAPVVATGPVTFADGEAAYQARNYVEAERIFAQYTEQRPENAWGHFMLGLSAWKGGDLAKAEKAFEASLTIDPNHVKSLVNLSRVLLDEKRADDAVARLMQAGDLDPGSADVHRLLGRAYQAQGKTEDAVLAYKRAIEFNPDDTWAMNNLGLLLVEQGKAADAVPLLTRATELGKGVAVFHNNLGMALEHAGQFGAAVKAYGGALEADPGYEKAKRNLARVEQVKESPTKEPGDLKATALPTISDDGESDETAQR
jgi:tetratricopeptide (TPR) repeat protein